MFIRKYFEYQPDNLELLTKEHIEDSTRFTTEEITNLIYDTIEAGKYLQHAGRRHGGLCPNLIFRHQ